MTQHQATIVRLIFFTSTVSAVYGNHSFLSMDLEFHLEIIANFHKNTGVLKLYFISANKIKILQNKKLEQSRSSQQDKNFFIA